MVVFEYGGKIDRELCKEIIQQYGQGITMFNTHIYHIVIDENVDLETCKITVTRDPQ